MRHQIEQRATVTREIQDAVQLEVTPYYQPKVDLVSGRVAGFEALALRRSRIQLSIGGERMIRRVAADIRQWIDSGVDCGRIAVEPVDRSIRLDRPCQAFHRHLAGGRRSRRALEITETVFLGRSSTHVVAALKQFHDSGIGIALEIISARATRPFCTSSNFPST